MIFCPKCGSILRPKEKAGKKILWCSCGFVTDLEEEKPVETKDKQTHPSTYEQSSSSEPEELVKEEGPRRVEIAEEIETHPKIPTTCEKCSNGEAYFWTQQTRGADEPETRFFKCTKCKHCWREYS